LIYVLVSVSFSQGVKPVKLQIDLFNFAAISQGFKIRLVMLLLQKNGDFTD